MTFDELAAAVRRVPANRILTEIERILALPEGVDGLKRGISVGAVHVMLQMGLGPGMRPVRDVPAPALDGEIISPAHQDRPRKAKAKPDDTAPPASNRGRSSKKAREFVLEQLAEGPKAGEDVQAAAEAASIPERSLLKAASSLGVLAKKGVWKLPDSDTNLDTDNCHPI